MRDKNRTVPAKPMHQTQQTAAGVVRPGDRSSDPPDKVELTACDPFVTFSEWASEEDERLYRSL